MSALLDLARDALVLAVMLGLPLVAVALVAGLLAGWLGQLTGVQDPAVGAALRVGAIVLAVWWTGEAMAERITTLTAETWDSFARIGRAGVPSPPGAELEASESSPIQ